MEQELGIYLEIIDFFENIDSQANVDLFILNYMEKLNHIEDEEVISNALILMMNFLSSDRCRIITRGVQCHKISDDKKNIFNCILKQELLINCKE